MDNTNHTPEGRCPKCGAEWSGQPQSPSTSEVSDDMLDELNHWLSGHGACVFEDSKREIISRLLAMKVADQSPSTSLSDDLDEQLMTLVEPITKAILFEDCGNTADWKDNTNLGIAVIKMLRSHYVALATIKEAALKSKEQSNAG